MSGLDSKKGISKKGFLVAGKTTLINLNPAFSNVRYLVIDVRDSYYIIRSNNRFEGSVRISYNSLFDTYCEIFSQKSIRRREG